MDTITLSLPQLFATGAVFAVIGTVLAVASNRAGRATGYEIGKVEGLAERRDGLTCRVEKLEHDLRQAEHDILHARSLMVRSSVSVESERWNNEKQIELLKDRLAELQLTPAEAFRLQSAARTMRDSIKYLGPDLGNAMRLSASTIVALVERLPRNASPVEESVLLLPAPQPEQAA